MLFHGPLHSKHDMAEIKFGTNFSDWISPYFCHRCTHTRHTLKHLMSAVLKLGLQSYIDFFFVFP